MKKSLFLTICCLAALCGLQAQTIQNGSKWWDGAVLYTAHVTGTGVVEMRGVDEHEGGFRFDLVKVAGKAGQYTLAADCPDVILPVRGNLGWRVDYIRQDGMYFLAIRKPSGDVCWTLLLTPDNLHNCIAQEREIEQKPVGEVLGNVLISASYLSHFSKAQLRIMRNEILARHGWKFQSKDLQEHFGAQSWYKPVANNNTIKLNIIEQTNVQLIKSEEGVSDEDRGYMPKAEDFPGGLAEDGRGPDEVDGEMVYTVLSEADFFASLGNNRTILIGENVHLNLSNILENEEEFKGRPGRRWSADASSIIVKQPLVVSEIESDGRQLVLLNFENLIIKGAHNASIEVNPRYSFCISFANCKGCEVRNLTIGHTEGGQCSGGVIGVRGGRNITVSDCDLYGCGTYGVALWETTDFTLRNSNIHDCTYGIMELRSNQDVLFENCDFFSNREYALIEGYGNEQLSFVDCRFFANWADAPLFQLDNTFFLSGCKIYHPAYTRGTIDMADQSGKKNLFFEDPLDASVKPRGIGPK